MSRRLAPLDSPPQADFMAALDEVNAEADCSPGFVWRLQTEDGNATAVRTFGWDAGAFPFRRPFPPPGARPDLPATASDDWALPRLSGSAAVAPPQHGHPSVAGDPGAGGPRMTAPGQGRP